MLSSNVLFGLEIFELFNIIAVSLPKSLSSSSLVSVITAAVFSVSNTNFYYFLSL